MRQPNITPAALRDINSIWLHIARDSEYHADLVQDAIFECCNRAAKDPDLGHRRFELSQRPIRFLAVKRYEAYAVAYVEDSNPLRILRVLHGARNVARLFREVRK